MKKVLLVTNIVSPYRIPLYNYISQNKDFEFRVIALAEKEKNREWILPKKKIKFSFEILQGLNLFFTKEMSEIPIHINVGLFERIWKYKPDIIITSGYDSLAYWQSFFYCKIFRKKYILWNGTTLLSSKSIHGFRGILKRIIIRGADKYIVYGTKAKEYLEYFGAKPKNIFISTNTVDIKYFHDNVFENRTKPSFLEERKKYPKILFLYIGRLVKLKGLIQTLKAFKVLNSRQIGLMIVGSGSEEENLKKFSKENKIKNIFFKGFHQQDELPKYYALADVLILPSFREVWGLVVNEALAGGLYVLSSKYAGASYDIIKETNGKILDPDNVSGIAEKIKFCENNLEKIKKRRISISNWATRNIGIEKNGNVFISGIKSLL